MADELDDLLDGQEEEKKSNKLVIILVTILIVLIWLAIFVLADGSTADRQRGTDSDCRPPAG